MSILINGMKMPKACCECRMYEADIYYCSAAERDIDIPSLDEGRCSFCPLVELPAVHGDLIDAEEEMRLMQAHDYDTYNDYSRAFDMLDNAPTIIPAERSENDV